jgi:hypothetical protein
MTFVRVTVIAVMVGTLALSSNPEADFGLDRRHRPAAPLPLARPAGLAEMLPVAIFCQNLQIGVPALLQPMAHTRGFSRVFGIALGLCLFMCAYYKFPLSRPTFPLYRVFGIALSLFVHVR